MVFVEEPAEQVTSMHPSWLAVADDPQVGEWIRRLQSERPVGTVMVVVGDVDPEHLLEVSSPANQQPVQALGPHRADPALGVGVGVGACTGVTSASVPSDRNTSSKARVNFASRSRMRNRGRRFPSISSRLRACWATQAPSGWAVTPAK